MSEPARYIVVAIAIREDEVIRLHFPSDITQEEAAKVARVIQAYAVDATPSRRDQGGQTQ